MSAGAVRAGGVILSEEEQRRESVAERSSPSRLPLDLACSRFSSLHEWRGLEGAKLAWRGTILEPEGWCW